MSNLGKIPAISEIFFHMSIAFMLPVDFKKRLHHPVVFKSQRPQA